MSDRLTFTIHPIEETSSLDLLFKSLENIRLLLRDVDHSIYGSENVGGVANQQHQIQRPHSRAHPRAR